ncbi:MAG: hypothetical protein ACXVYY_16840 [Oryzihumus sp.]
MRILRGLLGALLWILAAVVGLVGAILCVTLILLPLGLPLLGLARQLFTKAVRLMLPPALAHPIKEAGKSARKKERRAATRVPSPDLGAKSVKRSRRWLRRQRKRLA